MGKYLDKAKEQSSEDTDRKLLERILANQYMIKNMLIDFFEENDGNEDDDGKDEEDNYEKEEMNSNLKKIKEEQEKTIKKIKKMKNYQNSFCKKCGSPLPKSNWTGGGYGKCTKCKDNYLVPDP